jgi:hypothetical protein
MKRLTALLVTLLMICGTAWGTTVYVGTVDGDSATVSLGASALSDTDTLYIRDGTYSETAAVTIADSCVVMGEGMLTTIVDLYGGGSYGWYVTNGSDNNTVDVYDLTIISDSSVVRFVTSASTNEDCSFTRVKFTNGSLGSTDTDYFVYGDPDITLSFTDCVFLGTQAAKWQEVYNEPALNSSASPTFTNCTFTNASFNGDKTYGSIILDGCTGAYSLPSAPGAANFYVFDYGGTYPARPLGVTIKNSTFVGANASEADSVKFFYRASHDVSSDSIYSNTLTNFGTSIFVAEAPEDSLTALGSGTYICDNTITGISAYGIVVSTNSGTMQGNTVTNPTGGSVASHGIMLGHDSRVTFVADTNYAYGWDVSGNTVTVDNGLALVFKGDYNKVYSNTFSGGGTGVMIAGRDIYFAHNTVSGGNKALYFRQQPSGSTAVTHWPVDNIIKNNIFNARAASSASSDSVMIYSSLDIMDSLNYPSHNTFVLNGRTVSMFWYEEGTERTFANWIARRYDNGVDTTLHGIESGYPLAEWEKSWGGDTTFVITPTYNFYTLGATQATTFPTVGVSGASFERLEDADSLLTVTKAWAENDPIIYPVHGGNQELNAHRDYEIARYITTGSDTLFIVPTRADAINVWK